MNSKELAKSMNQRIKQACEEYPNDIAKIYTSGGCDYIVNDSMLFDLMQNTIPLEDVMPCPPVLTDQMIIDYIKNQPYYGHCTEEHNEGIEQGAKWARAFMQGKEEG